MTEGLPYRLSRRSVQSLWTTHKSVCIDSCIKITDKWKCPKTTSTSLPYKISASTVKRFMGYMEKSTYRLFKLRLHYESKCLKIKHPLTLLGKNYDSIQQNLWKLMGQTVKSVWVKQCLLWVRMVEYQVKAIKSRTLTTLYDGLTLTWWLCKFLSWG